MTIKIENYRECPEGEKHLAFFDLYLPKITLTFRNLKLVKAKNGNHFISYPSFVESEDALGKKIFAKYFEFSSEKQKEFEEQIFQELAPFVRGPIQRYTNNSGYR